MKKKSAMRRCICAVPTLALVFALAACAGGAGSTRAAASGSIYLYGEEHAQQALMEEELALWRGYYENDGLRHLFVESAYFTAEFLNLWMRADGDEILNALYEDWAGTAARNAYSMDFYKTIKRECPETVFHGTDVGHQYATTGERYLRYLRENGEEDSEQYRLAREAIEQGEYYYAHSDDAYRENKMTENFIRAFNALDGESVMGIYGTAHTDIAAMDYATQTVPCMANRLHAVYGDALTAQSVAVILQQSAEPERMETVSVCGREYEAAYFGEQEITGIEGYASREFWRLENAYDDFKEKPKPGDVLPYDNYPMAVEAGQAFRIVYHMTDGSAQTLYYHSDGNEWEGMPVTEQFTPE